MPVEEDLTVPNDVILNENDRVHVRIQRLPGNPEETYRALENNDSLLVDLKIDQVG